MCIGKSNNPVTAQDYYQGYRAEDGSYVGGMKQNYGPLPSLGTGEASAPRESGMKDIATEGLSRGTGRQGQQRRTFFTQYGTGN